MVFFICFVRVGFGYEGDGIGIEIKSINVMLGKEVNMKMRVLSDGVGCGLQFFDEKFENCCFISIVGFNNINFGVELNI